MRWRRHGALRELASAWRDGRRREALLALATWFPEGSPQAATRDLLERLAASANPALGGPAPLTPTGAQRELRDLSAFQAADDLDREACVARILGMVERAEAHPALGWLASEGRALLALPDKDTPLQVAILGSFSTGKSSLVNAILGSVVLPTGPVPVTALLTVLRWGAQPGATVMFRDGERRFLELSEIGDFIDQRRESGAGSLEVDRLEVEIPVGLLKRITLYDTPGFNSGHELHELVTERIIDQADAVLWVFDISQLGSESERKEIAHIRRSTGKAIALVNKIDDFEPRRFERTPEAWRARLQGAFDEIRANGPFAQLIDHWVPVSAHWIEQGREEGGMGRIEAVLAQIAERKEQIQADARLRHLREAARRARALEEIVAGEEREERERREAWTEAFRRWAAELRADWRQEVQLARRQRQPPPPQCPADGGKARRLGRVLIPELSGGIGGESAAVQAPWRSTACDAWSALDGLAAVMASGGHFGPFWEAALHRARTLESVEPAQARRWRSPAPSVPRRSIGSLVDLLLLGDVVLESAVDAWIEGSDPSLGADASSPSGRWHAPCAAPDVGFEALLERLPCSRDLLSGLRQRYELSLVQSACKQLFVRPAERWAVALGFLRPRGPLETPIEGSTREVVTRIEERCFARLPRRARRNASLVHTRSAWTGAPGLHRGPPPLPDPTDTSAPRKVRRLAAAVRPGLEAAVAGRLREHVSLLQRRSWWALCRVVVWAALLSFLGAFAHVEVKEWLDFDVAESADRAALGTASLHRAGAGDLRLPELPDIGKDGALRAWAEEVWERLAGVHPASAPEPLPAPAPAKTQPKTSGRRPNPREKLETACSQGDPPSCADLGRLLLTGSGGQRMDERGAGEALAKACHLGDDDAPCLQAGVIARAQGEVSGRAEAIDLFALACDRGALDGCAQAAALVTPGSAPSERSAAGLWLSRACRGGRAASCADAADIYLQPGSGVAFAGEACELLVSGCGASHRGSCERLAALVLREGLGDPCPGSAVQVLREACLGGQEATCWAAATAAACPEGADGACGTMLAKACAQGHESACPPTASGLEGSGEPLWSPLEGVVGEPPP